MKAGADWHNGPVGDVPVFILFEGNESKIFLARYRNFATVSEAKIK